MTVFASAAVEGDVDEAILRRLANENGIEIHVVYGKGGKNTLLAKLDGYNSAAQFSPWIIFIDLDQDHDCAPIACKQWLPTPSPFMCFRIVVHEIEAWLLADRVRIAEFLGVPRNKIPTNPDDVVDPKELIVQLASSSRRKEIREGVAPRPGSGRKVGPLYTSTFINFVMDGDKGWQSAEAAKSSQSLTRCIRALSDLKSKA